ncbi:MAG: ATP-binding cassette domain-containing protein, partial [Treponema sp.]|nr:ATP-binding cassette domain-containing protein [Treponema sp.]
EKPAYPKEYISDPLIEAKNLSFEFTEGKRVLEDINLSIGEGTITGILGRTGSGKSTLLKIITRIVDPPQGTVFVKGVELAAWDLVYLRKLFGVTPQDSYLFSDSIRNNISYGLNENTDESISARAATLASLQKDFSSFQNGWETIIGERGLTLSGGQKQRTAIARSVAAVIAGNKEIIVFDDSLSAVDVETEKMILDGLFEFGKERKRAGLAWSMIIISHRISALSRSDEVIVLDKGRIIEQGTPIELTALGGFYARTETLQSLGQNLGSGSRNG